MFANCFFNLYHKNMKRLIKVGIVVVVVVSSLLVLSAVYINHKFQVLTFDGHSMKPTLKRGDRVLILKGLHSVERGSLVAYTLKLNRDLRGYEEIFVKRVVGIPGDEILLKNNNLYINGQLFDFPGRDKVNSGSFLKEGMKVTVPQGYYFIIGDNPPFSYDSRQVGFVKKDNILGTIYSRNLNKDNR